MAAGASFPGENILFQRLSFLLCSDELIFLQSSVSKFVGASTLVRFLKSSINRLKELLKDHMIPSMYYKIEL